MKNFNEWLQERDPELLAELQQNEEAMKALRTFWTNLQKDPMTGRTPGEEDQMRRQAAQVNQGGDPTRGIGLEQAYQLWFKFTNGGQNARKRDPNESPKITFKRHLKRMVKEYQQGRKDFKQRWGFDARLLQGVQS